ncbi:MAG TPA: 2-oxoglutarate and iron-dependent oxygenase domain-containing protein [Burkholderiaceae bacterium]|nr:2-oxoglutarate and iron-dependent oxygenase domain-containing protein [Burkholderiaceae bacterium]
MSALAGPAADRLPVIDLTGFDDDPARRRAVAAQIGAACRMHGFFYVAGHGVAPAACAQLEDLSRRFFALPLEEKLRIEMAHGGRAWRGYFPVGNELTSGMSDRKEGLYLGTELAADHPLVRAGTPVHGPNLFPSIDGFRATVLEYIEALTGLGHRLMAALALSLDLPQDYFACRYTADPLILFRIFNYPAPACSTVGEWGVGEHTDYGLLTMLLQDDNGGLEVKSNGRWIDAPPIPGTFVCNIGDMLDRMTRGLYRSNPHRVRPSGARDRLSFPLFFDPNFFARIEPIAELADIVIDDDRASRWDHASVHAFDGTYGDYLIGKISKVFPQLSREAL